MAAIWPLALPQTPLVNGYKESQPSHLLRSQTDTGPAKVRRRGHAKPVSITATYLMTEQQLDLFDSFATGTIMGGALAFDWWDARNLRYVRARIVPQGEDVLYERQPHGTTLRWQVTLRLEVFPDAPLT